MQITLTDLRKNLSFSHHERIQPSRDTHQVPDGIFATEHEQILAQRANGQITTLRQVLRDSSHGRTGISRCVVYFKAVASTQDGCFGYGRAAVAEFIAGVVPVGFWNGQLFTHFDIGMVNRKTHTVHLQTFRGSFQTFLTRTTGLGYSIQYFRFRSDLELGTGRCQHGSRRALLGDHESAGCRGQNQETQKGELHRFKYFQDYE
mmetsp:Transcript_1716/g.3742  ORF Transcript_1716/g.3742 Transcript_1716/m.3742 type:complete len:204 (-) Transcript_1716:108-719(-)